MALARPAPPNYTPAGLEIRARPFIYSAALVKSPRVRARIYRGNIEMREMGAFFRGGALPERNVLILTIIEV